MFFHIQSSFQRIFMKSIFSVCYMCLLETLLRKCCGPTISLQCSLWTLPNGLMSHGDIAYIASFFASLPFHPILTALDVLFPKKVWKFYPCCNFWFFFSYYSKLVHFSIRTEVNALLPWETHTIFFK